MKYYRTVSKYLPHVQDFFRALCAPDVEHWGGGTGVIPDDILASLVAWVEDDIVPGTLLAMSQTGPLEKMNLCPYPAMGKYMGSGDTALAESFECADGFDLK